MQTLRSSVRLVFAPAEDAQNNSKINWGELQTVESLDLSDLSIAQLSDVFDRFPFLTEVNLCENDLTELPETFRDLRDRVTKVNLAGNNFTEVPDMLLEFENLEELHLGGNQITHLPVDIDRLQNLKVLYLGGNHLTHLPDSIGRMRSLEVLNVSENRLTELPISLAEAESLVSLLVNDNELRMLPSNLLRLRSLENMSLRNNPLVREFINQGYEAASLFELAGRAVWSIAETEGRDIDSLPVPVHLKKILHMARPCQNPECAEICLRQSVNQVDFVDFCGKFHVPFQRYLCSSKCGKNHLEMSDEISDEDEDNIRRIEERLLRPDVELD
eukprot:Clim_evm35s203 gene=Clim_evmTU35s203